ncbi:MAG TPA: hypothetical protein PLU67_06665 [Candidatus Kapabacteria bacterium]|jgi:hypothetical protein|nr:hypothetical protein [Candidatus Kapabacteria bacterium]HOQ48300.1 hypothetical protein [Candidatus Kapabacteria bacterium]HPU23805.1 hypothetical protein [Candidatus Kapabacteria bacterium]
MENQEQIKKKLLELLPDYVFRRLDESDREFFEMHYKEFEDIEKEVEEVQIFFEKLEQMDFDRVFQSHTVNTSVKVLNKMERKSRPQSSLRLVPKLALPLIAVIVIFIAIQLDIRKGRYIKIDQAEIAKLSEPIIIDSSIIDEVNSQDLVRLIEYAAPQKEEEIDDEEIEEMNNYLAEFMNNEVGVNYLDEFNIYNYFDYIDEDIFQEIIEAK